MKGSVHSTWILLMLMVVLMSASVVFYKGTGLIFIILGLSALKFLLVAFQFMEMKKAHIFWKVILTLFVIITTLTLTILRQLVNQ